VFYVYVLKSKKDNDLYIGSTSDLRRRLIQHNQGKVSSTKPRRPFELVYYEAFTNERLARMREARLKKRGNARYQLLKRIMMNTITEL